MISPITFSPISYIYFPQTPNHVLTPTDIPPRSQRTLPEGVGYPANKRYTLQWLEPPTPSILDHVSKNNNDAAFRISSRKPKPSDLLLHYNYGAAAVKQWGHGTKIFQHLAKPPCPSAPVPAKGGPSKTVHDRRLTIQKLNANAGAKTSAGAGVVGGGARDMVDSEEQLGEDDVVMILWANSAASKEHRQKQVEERTQRMEEWRESVPQFPV